MKQEKTIKHYTENRRKFVGDFVDEKPHGKILEYAIYEDHETLLAETEYVNGKKDCKEIVFYPNGMKRAEIDWVDGKKHGFEIIFCDDGETIRNVTPYVNGKKQGRAVVFPFTEDIDFIEKDFENSREHGLVIVHYKDKKKAPKISYCVEGVEVALKQYESAVKKGKAPSKAEEVALIKAEFKARSKKESEPGDEE